MSDRAYFHKKSNLNLNNNPYRNRFIKIIFLILLKIIDFVQSDSDSRPSESLGRYRCGVSL